MYKFSVNTRDGDETANSAITFDETNIVDASFENITTAASGYNGKEYILGAGGAEIVLDLSNCLSWTINRGSLQQVNLFPVMYMTSSTGIYLQQFMGREKAAENFPYKDGAINFISYTYSPEGSVRQTYTKSTTSLSAIYPITSMPFNDLCLYPTFRIMRYNKNPSTSAFGIGIFSFKDYIPAMGDLPQGESYHDDLWNKGYYEDDTYFYVVAQTNVDFYFGKALYDWSGDATTGNFISSDKLISRKSLTRSSLVSYNAEGDTSLPSGLHIGNFGFIANYTDPVTGGSIWSVVPDITTIGSTMQLFTIQPRNTIDDISYYSMSYEANPTASVNSYQTIIMKDYAMSKVEEMRTYYTRTNLCTSEFDFTNASTNGYYIQNGNVYERYNSYCELIAHAHPLKEFLAAMAATGYAVGLTEEAAKKAKTYQEINCPWVLRGNMDTNGITDGTYLLGEAANTQIQGTFSDLSDSPYKPVTPDTTGEDTEDDTGELEPNRSIVVGGASDFTTAYAITASSISILGRKLWEGIRSKTESIIANFFSIDENNATYYYNNIIDYFISLKYYPLSITELTSVTGKQGIAVGAGASAIFIGGGLWQVTNLTPTFTLGSITIPHTYNDFRDFEPYATITAYIPFCGSVDLTPSEVVGTTITLDYAVDLITGQCTAYLTKHSAATQIVASINGQLGFDILITGNNASSQAGSYISALGGKMNAPLTQLVTSPTQAAATTISSVLDTLVNTPNYLALNPLSAGSSTSMCGMLNPLQFSIVVKKHNVKTPSNYGDAVGYLVNAQYTLSQLGGFTVGINPDLSGIQATAEEIEQIRTLITTGIYL